MRRVRILEQAAEEAIEAAAWYEHERLGLGIEFAHAVNAAIDLLEDEIVPLTKMPGAAGARGVKRLILKRSRTISSCGNSPKKLSLSLSLISLDAQGVGEIVSAPNTQIVGCLFDAFTSKPPFRQTEVSCRSI